MNKSEDIGYIVTRPSEQDEKRLIEDVLTPRRGPIPSMPGVHLVEGCLMGDAMFAEFGMDEYVGCITGEMAARPIPQVFRAAETRPIEELYEEYAPHIMAWYLPQITPPYQSFNKVSRVGWPGFHRPDNKLEYVSQFMPEILAGDMSRFESAFTVFNVRLQPEPRSKQREFQFIGPDGKLYARTTDERSRMIRTPAGPRVGSRTRLVFNLPVYNLVKQALDTAIHNVFMRYPAFHHDMANGNILPVRGHHIALDIKHFERHTATCNRIRAALLGGVYNQCSEISARIPYAVWGDDFKSAFFLTVDRANGWSDQYGSGDSAVAPSQKEIMMAVYASFFEKFLGYTRSDAIVTVANGGESRLTIRNYGDDNSIDGDKAVCEDFVKYASQFLHVEEEKPPKFLGFVWYPELGKWALPVASYLQKNYLNERAPFSAFRKYPNFGLIEKRKVYMKQGHPLVHEKVIPLENDWLIKVGVPLYLIEARAQKERRDAEREHIDISNPLLATDKDWALTAEQKVKAGLATGLPPSATASMVRKLLGPQAAKKLTFSS